MSNGGAAKRLWVESAAVFAVALAFLFALAPTAPFTKELGVCESGAVRDVLAGNIILPHFLPGPIVHVPPLYWWTAALCVRAFGWTELALRLPSMVAAAATCAVIFAWLGASVSRRAGLWAAAALLLCHFFTDAARQPRMDSMLTLFISAAAVCLERAVSRCWASGNADTNRRNTLTEITGAATADDSAPLPHPRRTLYLSLAALMMALGILAKSVLGLLPGLVLAVYLIVRKRFWELFRIDLIVSFAVALVIGLSWFGAAFWVGGDKFLGWQVGMNLWHRFLPTGAGGAGYCAHPFYYFVPHTLKGFMPWSLYLPAAAIWLWPREGRRLSAPVVYALCWFAAIFGFFSSSEGKCLVYILPAFVPLAALVGCTIDYAIASPQERRALKWFGAGSAFIAVGALALALAALVVIVGGLPAHLPVHLHPTDREFLGIFGAMAARRAPMLMFWIAGFIVGAAVTLYAIGRMRVRLQIWGVALVAATGMLFWFGVMNPALAEHETLRGFAREVAQLVPPGATVGHIGLGDCDLDFYSPQPLPDVFHFRCDDDPAVPRYIVLRQSRFENMTASQRACLKPIAVSAPVDSKGPRILVEQITPSP